MSSDHQYKVKRGKGMVLTAHWEFPVQNYLWHSGRSVYSKSHVWLQEETTENVLVRFCLRGAGLRDAVGQFRQREAASLQHSDHPCRAGLCPRARRAKRGARQHATAGTAVRSGAAAPHCPATPKCSWHFSPFVRATIWPTESFWGIKHSSEGLYC